MSPAKHRFVLYFVLYITFNIVIIKTYILLDTVIVFFKTLNFEYFVIIEVKKYLELACNRRLAVVLV